MKIKDWKWKHLEGGYKPSPIALPADIQKEYLRMHCKLCGGPRYFNNRYQNFNHFEKCPRYKADMIPKPLRIAKFAPSDARKKQI